MPRKSKHDRLARDTEALNLRAAGLTYEVIAKRLGYANKSHAWKAVDGLLTERAADASERLIDLELARLDLLQRSAFQGALGGDMRALAGVVKVMDHRAKITGLYQVQVTSDDSATKQALAGFLAQATALAEANGATILQAPAGPDATNVREAAA